MLFGAICFLPSGGIKCCWESCVYPAAEQDFTVAKCFYPTAEQNVVRTTYFIPVTILIICIFIIPINVSNLRFSQQ